MSQKWDFVTLNLESGWGINCFWDASKTVWRQQGCFSWSLESPNAVICRPLHIYISLKCGAATPASGRLCIPTAVIVTLPFLEFCCSWPPKLYLKPYHSFSFSLSLSRVVGGWSHSSLWETPSKTKMAFEIWETVSMEILPSFVKNYICVGLSLGELMFEQISEAICNPVLGSL